MRKPLTTALCASLVLAVGLSVFLWLSWQRTERETQTGVEAIMNLIQINQGLNEKITASEGELASTAETIQSLGLERDQLAANKNALEEQAGLYQSQVSFLTDVLYWYNKNNFFQEASELISVYAAATGNIEP